MRKKILAICGSTRQMSTNLQLINIIVDRYKNEFDFTIFNSIANLPHFNPDIDNENPPVEVTTFRKQLRDADGVLICTPEYAMGVPGTLKNVIDWTVSSCEFMHKPTALITASSVGQKGHASLMETLNVIEARMNADTQLIISFVKTKVREANIIHIETSEAIDKLMNAFKELLYPVL